MIKLEEQNSIYHHILFIIWKLLNFYENLFGFYSGETARDIDCKLLKNKNLQIIQVNIPIIKEFQNSYTPLQMKIIFNEYLPLLLQGSDIPPYSEKKNKPPTEPLYTMDLETNGDYLSIKFLVIDCPEAYRLYLKDKSNTTLKII